MDGVDIMEGQTEDLLHHVRQHVRLKKTRHGVYQLKTTVSMAARDQNDKDDKYGLQVLQSRARLEPGQGLGLGLEELVGDDRHGIVAIQHVSGPSFLVNDDDDTYQSLRVGDIVVGVTVGTEKDSNQAPLFHETTTGFPYERLMETLIQAKSLAEQPQYPQQALFLTLQVNRLIERAAITVVLQQHPRDDASRTKRDVVLSARAGDNLRRLLQVRRDMVLGTCGGEGQCGMCLVGYRFCETNATRSRTTPTAEKEAATMELKKACQVVLGTDNQPGTAYINLNPTELSA